MPAYEIKLPEQGRPPYPLALILPILGRLIGFPDIWIERKIAKFFNRRGFATAVIKRGFFVFNRRKGIEQIGNYISRSVRNTQATLDELAADDRIDAERIGSLGISFGGIVNTILMAKDTRIKAGVIALAGGNIPEIIASSRDPLLRNYCDTALFYLRMTRPEFVEKLTAVLEEEPLKFAPRVPREKVLMMSARLDRIIFPRYGEALRKALQYPETAYLPLGHYLSMLLMPYLEYRTLRFFKKRFSA